MKIAVVTGASNGMGREFARILDGEGRVGANLIEISYKRNKILLECGTELETTEYGERVRKRIFQGILKKLHKMFLRVNCKVKKNIR